jgi:ATP-dependent Clp protease adapter protein ClpS
VRDLLCHHSGLPRHDWVHLPADLSPAQMLAAKRYLEPSDDIRSTFQYQNLGYLVAGMVAERVSGQSWAEFTRARLTDELRMKVTSFHQPNGTFVARRSAVNQGAGEPRFNIKLFNDDYTPMEFVVWVLEQVFQMDQEEATRIMLETHNRGATFCGV